MKFRNTTVYLPHINYTVRFRRFKPPPRQIEKAVAWIQRDNRHGCTIFTSEKNTMPPGLAHEILHALQFICEDRHMTFEKEFEHMAYLMQYLMGRAMGLTWKS